MEPCRVRGADLRAIEKTRIILEWILCICSSTSRDSAEHCVVSTEFFIYHILNVLAWKIPWTEAFGRLQSTGVAEESDTTEHIHNTHNILRY